VTPATKIVDKSRTFHLPEGVTDPAEAEELEQQWAARIRAVSVFVLLFFILNRQFTSFS
jgi:hypothetical protein